MASTLMNSSKPRDTRARNRELQQLTAQMNQGVSPSGMRPGGSAASGMLAVGQVGGTQASLIAAVLNLQPVLTPRVNLYVGCAAELR
ncbi:hypothetical protein IV102_20025 [bacterium]|nr:hypothetical protein [bacterium]